MSVEKAFRALDYKYIAAAVFLVYRQNRQHEIFSYDADADLWVSNSACRDDLFNRVRLQWVACSRKPITLFPYSVDYVCQVYLKVRDLSKEARKKWRLELKQFLPSKEQ